MLPKEEMKRPRSVTLIGRVWLVLAVLYMLRTLVNLIFWKLLQMGAPVLLRSIAEQSPYAWLLRPLFQHLTALMSTQVIASALVAFSAYQLLRLRAWARVVIQAVCWFALAWVLLFTAFWAWFWPRVAAAQASADPPLSAHSYGRIGLTAGVVICLAVGAGLAVMIALLRGSRVREAFRPPTLS
jgi:hypothetical protein